MENEVKKEDKHDCGCKCGFEHIIPKMMKFGLGEIITFAAIFLFIIVFILGSVDFNTFITFIYPISMLSGLFFFIFLFAEKFTCFESKYLKLVNTILIGITSVGILYTIFYIWGLPKSDYPTPIFGLTTGFSFKSLILFILIIGANAYWAFELIMGFIAKQQESAALAKPVEEKVVEPEKAEEPEKKEEAEEKPEEKEESEDKPEESEEKSDDEKKED